MILAASLQHHCKVLDLGIARDDEEVLENMINTAISAGVDIILTSGGVSMGDRDYVKPLFQRRGTVHFSKVGLICSHSHMFSFTLYLLVVWV